jgi:transposase-like protein
METLVKCPHCGSYKTGKTSNGKLSDAVAKTGAVVGGALINMVTGGIGGLLGANLGYGQTWHQYCCHDCHEVFKVRLSTTGAIKEIKKY